MSEEEILNTFLLANIPEIITQEEFDDVKKAIKELQQENKQLREKVNKFNIDKINNENKSLKGSCKVLGEKNNNQRKELQRLNNKIEKLKVINEEHKKLNGELREEIRRLKKQLTTYQILHRDCNVDNLKNISKIEKMENQQKEFIEYLEDKICIANKVLDEQEEDEEIRGYVLARKFMLEEILSKFKEIIGKDINVTTKGDKDDK